ncbi:hypothetical protein BB558_005848 [Smittium angustum]|uniref:glutamate--tRNA ligase n=1 Tax=Smittium angustum TaxID=133377 RepID=A0A2U1IZF0_SMIAN|nr:hypothetical protein BB558_005848 [Smittium angustum]
MISGTLNLAKKGNPVPFTTCVLAEYLNSANLAKIEISWAPVNNLVDGREKINSVLVLDGVSCEGGVKCNEKLLGLVSKSLTSDQKEWVDFAIDINSTDFSKLSKGFDKLENHLFMRSFLVGYKTTIADLLVWGVLRESAIFQKNLKANSLKDKDNLVRWYKFISEIPEAANSVKGFETAVTTEKAKDQGSFDLGLKNLVHGQVCTRFPPEPSGYLHIGHAKAAMMNQYIAKTYGGKLIIRFDDTNPSKEKTEFEETITEDLKLLGIEADFVSHTSDYFGELQKFAHKMILDGHAYCDDTDQATMREQRMVGEASKCRDITIDESLRRFGEIVMGSEEGQKYCLRAKISVDDKNKALRDPVIYRVNLTPHHRTGSVYKAYPLYDFACPIVDSIEGVTHALRSNEYKDRNPLYYWIAEKAGLRQPQICDFSRLNFVYTLLSKRKLQWFVDEGFVTGWDDPRFPTVRGIRRRGLTIEALRQYILMQGASQNQTMLEWDKLWSLNKKIIDPTAPRYTAVDFKNFVLVNLIGDSVPSVPEYRTMPLNKKNPDVGTKQVLYSNQILLEQADVASFSQGEEVTLMDWGNAFVETISRSSNPETGDVVVSATLKLNLQGNVKTTKKKVTWLGKLDNVSKPNAKLMDFDYLITKKKLEDSDDITDHLTEVTEFDTDSFVDPNLMSVKKGTIVQLERKGFYIVDKTPSETPDGTINLIFIPDGKAASLASKAQSGNNAPAKNKDEAPAKKTKSAANGKSPWGKSGTPSKSETPNKANTETNSKPAVTVKHVETKVSFNKVVIDQEGVSSMYIVDSLVDETVIDPRTLSSMYIVDRYIE